MYPYHRLLKMVLGNLFRKQEVNIDKEYHFQFRSGFGDIDVYPEVNNGRQVRVLRSCTIRYRFSNRLVQVRWRKNKYAFVIGGSTIRYRKRLAPFRKATVRSKIVGLDEKFYYFQQTIEQKGEVPKSSALIRAGIRFKGGSAPPENRNYEGFGLQTRTIHGTMGG